MKTSTPYMPKLAFNDNSNLLALSTLQLPDFSWINAFGAQMHEAALVSQRIHAAIIAPAIQMQKTMEALTSMFSFWELPGKQQTIVADPELKTVEKLKENQLLPKEVLIFSEGNFLLYGKTIKIQKINSQHYYLLRSLLMLQDSEGFCSYEKIEDFLRSQGLSPLAGDKMRKRIRNALQTAVRFYDLPPSISSGFPFLGVRKGKGLMIRNNIRQ